MLPLEKSRALKSQFGFVVADGLGGKQIPGGLVLATCHHQLEGLAMGRIRDRESHNTHLAVTTSAGIPKQAMFPRALAFADFTGFAKLVILILKFVILGPA